MTVKVRYPFTKKARPEWVEIPFDALDRAGGDFEVKLQGIPKEKLSQLEYALNAAKASYWHVQAKKEAAKLAAGDQVAPSDETDLHKALQVLQLLKDDQVKPTLKLMLRNMLEALLRKTQEEAGSEETLFLDQLRELVGLSAGLPSQVLAFAEALYEGKRQVAEQLAEGSLADEQAEALRAIRDARAELVRVGLADHRGIIGELTLEDGSPLLEDGVPKEAEIPFVASTWRWAKEKRRGVSDETLVFYREAQEGEGLLLSLSEAVLLWQKGQTPTLALIWDAFIEPETPKEEASKEAPATEAPAHDEAPASPSSIDGDEESEAPIPFVPGA